MSTRTNNRSSLLLLMGAILISALLMAACNLGAQAPSEPFDTPTPDISGQSSGQTDAAGGDAGQQTGPTNTPQIQVPPTNTPQPELLESEQLGPITIDGADHRTQEAVTVRVRRGTSVSTVTCSWNHQDTGQSNALGSPTTNQINENVVEDVYTFTPELAGTYNISCNGVALTSFGQQAVSSVGQPFSVEAKG